MSITVTITKPQRTLTLTRSSMTWDVDAGRLLTTDERAALDAATAPDADNPLATLADANVRAVSIQSDSYTLLPGDAVVVFTATATATLPAATGSRRTYRIVCRAGTLTVDADGPETIKGAATAVLSAGEDLILTDTATGVWE